MVNEARLKPAWVKSERQHTASLADIKNAICLMTSLSVQKDCPPVKLPVMTAQLKSYIGAEQHSVGITKWRSMLKKTNNKKKKGMFLKKTD